MVVKSADYIEITVQASADPAQNQKESKNDFIEIFDTDIELKLTIETNLKNCKFLRLDLNKGTFISYSKPKSPFLIS